MTTTHRTTHRAPKLSAREILKIRALCARHGIAATAMLSDRQARAVAKSLASGEATFLGAAK